MRLHGSPHVMPGAKLSTSGRRISKVSHGRPLLDHATRDFMVVSLGRPGTKCQLAAGRSTTTWL